MRSVRPTFVRIWREANELTTHAQRGASALDVYSVHAERIKIAHVKKIQRVHSVLLAPGTNGPRMHRWTCVRNTLGVRYVCARCSLDLNRRTYNEYPACAPRVPSALVWRPSGMFIHASSSAHIFVNAKNPDAHIAWQRVHSVGAVRSTHE